MSHTYGYYEEVTLWAVISPIIAAMTVLMFLFFIMPLFWCCLGPDPIQSAYESTSLSCCCQDLLKLGLQSVIQVTVGIAQFLYGPTLIKLKDKKAYKHKCLKIRGRYFKLTFKNLSFVLVYNVFVIMSTLTAMSYLLITIHRSYDCQDSLDCFPRDETDYDATSISNCSFYEHGDVICFQIKPNPALAIALLGGFIKIVPPISFFVTTFLYLRECHIIWKVLLYYIVLKAIFFIALIVAMLGEFEENKDMVPQVIAFFMLILVSLGYPWYFGDFEAMSEKEVKYCAPTSTGRLHTKSRVKKPTTEHVSEHAV